MARSTGPVTDRRRPNLRLLAVLGVLLSVVVLTGVVLTRSDQPRPGVDAAPQVRTFCSETGQGPCAELGGLSDVGYDRGGERDGSASPLAGTPFSALQLNLCNSGQASCYQQLNNGLAVGEALSTIMSLRPQVVTLNEICRDDVAVALHPAMVRNFPGDHVFWAFQPAADRGDSTQPYRCRNGDRYGIGILGRVRAADWNGVSVFHGLYPDQGGPPDELRVWLCVAAVDTYYACTTHLTYISPETAMRQCRRLLDVEIPAMRAAVGSAAPVLVAGDLNLRVGGTPDVRTCVPAGYRHTGDGNVQQLMVTGDLGVAQTRSYPMRRTDHAAWFVSFHP